MDPGALTAEQAGRADMALAAGAGADDGSDFRPGAVQAVLDLVPGTLALLAPLRDDSGEIVDYRVQAATPEAVEATARRGRRLVGSRLLEAYPTTATSELWDLYLNVLATGEPGELSPYIHTEVIEGQPATSTYHVRAQRYGAGLLVHYAQQDEEQDQAARLEQIQRLGNLGWAELDVVHNHTEWSSHMYTLFDRDRADGPMGMEELAWIVVAADLPGVQAAVTALLAGEEAVELTFRIRTTGGIRNMRASLRAARDVNGHPVKVSGLVQDVTGHTQAQLRLEEIEQQLADRQRILDAEHRLAEELRQIILPLPAAPLNLPGLQVAVRYLPAEQAALVGGDWYQATALADGTVLLAVGDVAGHGLAAAATMAELRHALAALTVTATADPAELLGYLNRLLCGREGDMPRTATAVIARFDWANGALTWAQAGHPAPLLVRDGEVSELPRPHGVLLGANPTARYRTGTVTLTSDDTLLLFTDGLVEPPGGAPDERVADVAGSLRASLAEGAECSLTDLLRRLPPANPADDTCILVARATAGGKAGVGQERPKSWVQYGVPSDL